MLCNPSVVALCFLNFERAVARYRQRYLRSEVVNAVIFTWHGQALVLFPTSYFICATVICLICCSLAKALLRLRVFSVEISVLTGWPNSPLGNKAAHEDACADVSGVLGPLNNAPSNPG